MAITTVGRSKELKKAKEKSIKLNPMGKTAQKEAAMKNWPKRKFKARAFIESVSDKNAPMKKARLEDSVRGKKMVFKKAGGRAGYNTGKTVQKTDPSLLDKAQVELEKKRIRDGKEIKNRRTQPDLEKRKKAMQKFQLGKKYNIGGRANLLEEMGRIDARRHPDAADRSEKRRVIGELNRGYKSGGAVLKGKKVGCQIK